eukprot:TRINITY_DN17989_c0_g1_i1.p1 TRINITY_DN17989_c0_g1~~TRINITY_DN17989_c0_g1_i1.p1  ORF type:complete len:1587 (+),score=333.95 TRINITY_DN17989_c0_g1_i1:53-4813(+)
MKADLQHPASLARVSVWTVSPTRRIVAASIFVALYAIAIQWCYSTAGEPLAAAIKELAEKEAKLNSTNSSGTTTEDLLAELADIEAEPHHSTEGEGQNATAAPKPLPSWYLPNAWAGAFFFTVCTLNALFFLLGQWLVWFHAASLFAPTTNVSEGCFVHVQSHPNKGSDAMCKLSRSAQAPHRLYFLFQRQRYEFVPASEYESERKEGEDIVGLGEKTGYVRLMKCPIDLPLAEYHSSGGLSEKDVEAGCELFGKNTLTVPTPKFLDLYKQQLMSPLVVFQFFTAILWMLDEYWQFVLFQMGMVLMLESTTVFQRIKTFGTLNSMSSKPYKIQVFRSKKWQEISSLDLLPGDIVSVKPAAKPVTTAGAKPPQAPTPAKDGLDENTGVVPCDCVLLRGDAVVNEATLTGESVPQMKDALQVPSGEEKTPLNIDGAHRVHMLFSGTQMVACHGSSADDNKGGAQASKASAKSGSRPPAPDGGCECYVVRTGFNSSQGGMMQMIEYSQHKLTDDSKETGYALLVLLFFALVAAGYVLQKGLEKGDRTTHELLIKCVIIITSTVPKQLPMQMAMAVNTALMGLMKNGVFCTEPYRVPLAGKVNVCVFDKTGTLTTDQLVPIGMMNPSGPRVAKSADGSSTTKPGSFVKIDGVASKPELNGQNAKVVSTTKDGRVEVECLNGNRVSLKPSNLILTGGGDGAKDPPHGLFPMADACPEALMVVAGCHALIEVDGVGVMGDPIELAALKGIEWRYESKSNSSLPGDWVTTEKAIENLQTTIKNFTAEEKDKKEAAEKQLVDARHRVTAAKAKASVSPLKSVKIKHRHHFSSKLQRMSVVAHVERDASPKGLVCLVKGSPEAIKELMLPGAAPDWYDETYREMAEHGLRVLALAYKWCDGSEPALSSSDLPPRNLVESKLHFGGFLAFGCKTRADSNVVLRSINEAGMATGMLTGDAPLTALHVAKEVSICSKDENNPCLLLEVSPESKLQWVRATGLERKPIPFKCPGVVELSRTNDLMVTETAMLAAAEASDGKLWEELHVIKVFARMSPQGKANAIKAMQKHSNATVFMCGDGGNDVGALKQAEVGLALLSGYGNTNTSDGDASPDGEGDKSAEDELNKQQKQLAKKTMATQKLMQAEMKAIQAELQKKQKQRMMEEVQKKADAGEAGVMSTVNVMKETMAEFKAELAVKQREIQMKYGSVYDSKKDAANLLKEELEAEMGSLIARPGDASVAAPFTSRAPSVRNVVDILRQGRCTLLSSLQNQQIMMLECIISSYTLSALSLEGGRSSDRQMMASSWLLMIASMAFAFATPVDRMSKTRPLNSLFNPAVFFSLLGQAAIHLACMNYAVGLATEEMGPVKLREVVDFHKKQKMIRLGQLCKDGFPPLSNITNATLTNGCPVEPSMEEDIMAWAMSMINTPFLPNLLNTVIWLVETSQMCAVTFVNYKGRPWMKGIMENHALFLSSFACIGLVGGAAWEVFPQANELIHLCPFPNDEFRWKVMALVFMSLGGTFIWDRICIAIFAPDIMKAMVDSAKETTAEDIIGVLRTLGKVVGCFAIYASGNPLIWIGAFWYYQKSKREAAEREAAANA